jgi:hypothetical protein
MSVTSLVPVEEYPRTSYPDGDREFFVSVKYPAIWSAVEVRVLVKATRFRVPDV